MAVQVAASPPAITVLWMSSSGSSGPPMVAGNLVWTISQNAPCTGSTERNGKAVVQWSIGTVANHFPTPSIGDGLLLAPWTGWGHASAGKRVFSTVRSSRLTAGIPVAASR